MIPVLSGAPPVGVRVLIATRPVDFRRGADGLAATVQSVLRQDPFSGTIFVFRSKRADRVKMLVYDGTGLVLIWKRLEGTKFKWLITASSQLLPTGESRLRHCIAVALPSPKPSLTPSIRPKSP